VVRDVEHVDPMFPQEERETSVVVPVALLPRDVERTKVGAEGAELQELAPGPAKEIFGVLIGPGDVGDQVPDVRPDAELVNPPDVDSDAHVGLEEGREEA
jgi:hypothetical protein